jgi:hypothetical protein
VVALVPRLEPLQRWPRPHFRPGGGDAHLFYKVQGRFPGPAEIEVSRSRHRTAGVPAGCEVQRFERGAHPEVLGLGLDDGWIGNELRRTNAALAGGLAAASGCLVLRGVVTDPSSLDYFRDVVGLVMALLDQGGAAVFDPHQLRWWSAAEWREKAFEPAGAEPGRHVSILVSDGPGGRWYHTRGMIKFGRPDLSVRGVAPGLEPAVEDLCKRFIEMQAAGAVVPEGQEITMRSLPSGWRCRHRGDLEDPDFNNRHIEIGPG